VTWGEDVILDHPADERIAQLKSNGAFDPWAAVDEPHGEAEPNVASQCETDGDTAVTTLYDPWADEVPSQGAGVGARPPVGGGTYLPDAYGVGDEDERRRLYFYGPRARIEDNGLRIERAWLVGSLHARAVAHLDDQNEADCAEADRAGELNPPTDGWFAAAEDEVAGWGEAPGPKPPALHARPGAVPATARLVPASLDGTHGADGPDGSGCDWLPREWFAGPVGSGRDGRLARAPPLAPARLPARLDPALGGGGRLTGSAAHDPRRALTTLKRDGTTARLIEKNAKLQRALQKAGRLGLLGDLAGRDAMREGETDLARDLRHGMLQRARETYDVGRLTTSLEWFEEFQADARRHPTFMPLSHSGDIEAKVYNQETLDMFSEYIRRRGSRMAGRRGECVKSDTIAVYVGQIKKLRTHEAHHAITDPGVNVISSAAHKRMRQLDGPAGERKLSLGLRARHLRQAAALGFDRRSSRGALEWGAALMAHNLLARGGEICVCENAELDPERDLTLGAIEFMEPSEVSDDLPWLTAEFVPIKDTEARRRSVVMPIRRRAAGGKLGEDPIDAFDAIVMAMAVRLKRMPPARGRVQGPEASLPLFVGPKGKPWNTADSRRLARRIAASLDGLDETLYGGKAFRIGGATDYRAVYGPEAAERLIRQRGRWWSDIHRLYERALASEHLQGSAAVGDARGAELEALCKGWAQPANFR